MAKRLKQEFPKCGLKKQLRTQEKSTVATKPLSGVNKYRLEKEEPIDILEIDNAAVRLKQIERLKALKAGRDENEVQKALDAITACAAGGQGNLLELAVEAAKKRASLGEISMACEKVAGRYKAVIKTIEGVYKSEVEYNDEFKEAQELVKRFAGLEGRQPRIMIAKMGQDGHDREPKWWQPVMLTWI